MIAHVPHERDEINDRPRKGIPPRAGEQNPAYGLVVLTDKFRIFTILMLRPIHVTLLGGARWLLLVVCAVAAIAYVYLFNRLPATSLPATGELQPPAWRPVEQIPAEQWSVFQKSTTGESLITGPIAQRFRLAGTFFLYGEGTGESPESHRQAILDDLGKQRQYLVSEGDKVDEFEVARVYQDRVILRSDGMEAELRLSFSDMALTSAVTVASAAESPGEETLETTRFGRRVGEARWVFGRDPLLTYYHELLDDPERIAALYVSLKPDFKEDGIAGYYLDMEGEEEFFKAVGLRNGDVIRKVNSMNMTSQKRAEYFMGEFIKSRLNAFVLDIEREGKPEKLIYLIR